MAQEAELPEDIEEGEDVVGAQPIDLQPDRNAFSMMMSSAKKQPEPPKKAASKQNWHRSNMWKAFTGRDGLGAYLENPKQKLVMYENEFCVVIQDMYPKALVHTLLIPKDSGKTFLHPFDAFEDPEFLAATKHHVAELKARVARELRDRLGKYSETEKIRRNAMDNANETPGNEVELPLGRDWESELLVGIHSGPSMNHLHVHVLSPDHFSECMRHRKHYNSFATPFLVRLEEFPLPQDDPRRQNDRGGWLRHDLKCWRCDQNFGNSFSSLKVHLEEEFDKWKRI